MCEFPPINGVSIGRSLPVGKTRLHTRQVTREYYASAALVNANNRSGVTGKSVIRTPSGRSASSIAETMAAGAPMVPLSAAPLTPSGLSGVGDSM